MSEQRLVLVGPDPAHADGGVAVAMDGFARALEHVGALHSVVPAYRVGHRVRPTLSAVKPMLSAVRAIRRAGHEPVVYAHAGGPVSVARKCGLLAAARQAGARTMLQIHSVELDDMSRGRRGRLALGLLLKPVDVVVTVAEVWREMLQRRMPGLPRVEVVPDPLPSWAVERARQGGSEEPREGPLRVLCMTRLTEGKGVNLAIEAMLSAPADATLQIAGDGPLRTRLQWQIDELGLQARVRLVGWLRDQEKQRALEQCDVFLLPTRFDSFGMGFVEAAAYAVPSVALRWGAIPEVVLHGETGLLVDDPDSRALGAALHALADPTLRHRLGLQAQQHALEHLGPAAIGARILEASRGGSGR